MTSSASARLVFAIALSVLGGCSTASLVEVHSVPEGAQIWVQGVATGKICPAIVDLEAYAADPDQPMTLEVRLDGFVPTTAPPYPPRHRCSQWICEHKRQQYLPCWLPLYRSGTGVRIDTRRDGYEVCVDDGPWILVSGPPASPRAIWGVSVAVEPGEREFRWRPRDENVRRSFPEHAAMLRIPPQGHVAVDFAHSMIYTAASVYRRGSAGR